MQYGPKLSVDSIREILKKTRGGIAWGLQEAIDSCLFIPALDLCRTPTNETKSTLELLCELTQKNKDAFTTITTVLGQCDFATLKLTIDSILNNQQVPEEVKKYLRREQIRLKDLQELAAMNTFLIKFREGTVRSNGDAANPYVIIEVNRLQRDPVDTGYMGTPKMRLL